MYHRLLDFISKNNLLCTNQFGFREKHSTFMAFPNLIYKISDKKFSMSIFIDLSKAFDTIDHTILIDKLYRYSISSIPLYWFINYLENNGIMLSW